MPNGFDAVQHWRRHAHQLREGLLKRVEELSVSDYPEATANRLFNFLIAFLRELGSRIDRTTAEQELRFVSQLIQNLGVYLEWLDNANTSQTPRALAHLLKALMDRMEPQSGVVAIPQAKYNYSIRNLGDSLKKIVEYWVPKSRHHAFDQFTSSPIKLIAFPRIERDNVVAHAIFGHELGHPIATAFLDGERTDAKHQAKQTEIQKQVDALAQAIMKSAGGSPAMQFKLQTQIFDDVLQIRLRAIEELVSDFVGVRIFGPSAVFAMYDLLWTGDWDSPPTSGEWYPPSRQRLRLMLEQLEQSGAVQKFLDTAGERGEPYGTALSEFVAQTKALTALTSDRARINADPTLKIAYDWVEETLPDAFAFAEARAKDVAFNVDEALKHLPELLYRLELGIPPNEVGDPLGPTAVDFRASLLAAWIYKMGAANEKGEPLSTSEIDKLNLQTLLAVEYVILREKYEEHAKAGKGP
jgi:hypothetical protein